MADQLQLPRVSDEVLLQLKRAVAEKMRDRPFVVRAFCWLLDKTEGLTKQVTVQVPVGYKFAGKQIAFGFHDLRSATCASSIMELMRTIGNGFTTWSFGSLGTTTFRLAIREYKNTGVVKVPFNFAEIMNTPLPD